MNQIQKVVIAGGSGYLGTNLAQYLINQGMQVSTLSRKPTQVNSPWKQVLWDGRSIGEWVSALEGSDAIINLAGRTVDCIKTPDHCDEILRSPVESTTVLGKAVCTLSSPPAVWIQMSTAHIYGDPPETMIDEDSAFGYGLAPDVGQAWERAFHESAPEPIRKVILRTSFVLGRHGGALKRLIFLTKMGLGGTIGHGRQGISWIHETDMNRLFADCIKKEDLQGTYLATAPHPVSNREFMKELRKAVGAPFGLPAAAWMVRIGAPLFLRTDPELALFGRYCRSKRLNEIGFEFKYPELRPAFQNLF